MQDAEACFMIAARNYSDKTAAVSSLNMINNSFMSHCRITLFPWNLKHSIKIEISKTKWFVKFMQGVKDAMTKSKRNLRLSEFCIFNNINKLLPHMMMMMMMK